MSPDAEHPQHALVVGVGASSGADPERLRRLLHKALDQARLGPEDVTLLATVDAKEHEPAIVALARHLDVELHTFPAEALAAQPVPTPSPVVAAAVGTPSVAEAAALLAAGPGAELIVPKQRTSDATVAIARAVLP